MFFVILDGFRRRISLTNDFNLTGSMDGTGLFEVILSKKYFNLVASGDDTDSSFSVFETSE